ncbi:Hypothetical predicted protein, partial [Marmota monax]
MEQGPGCMTGASCALSEDELKLPMLKVFEIVVSQLAQAPQFPIFMPFMNNGSVVSAWPKKFKMKDTLLPVTLRKMNTESISL